MKKINLNELMGGHGAKAKERKLSLDDLGDLLGERMPKIEFSPVGRHRLVTALRNRFGDNYKHLPGIEEIIEEFDREAAINVRMQEIKQIKYRSPKGDKNG